MKKISTTTSVRLGKPGASKVHAPGILTVEDAVADDLIGKGVAVAVESAQAPAHDDDPPPPDDQTGTGTGGPGDGPDDVHGAEIGKDADAPPAAAPAAAPATAPAPAGRGTTRR